MPYAMLTFRIKPGHEEELTRLFAEAPTLETPVVTNDRGEETARLIGTGVFVKDDVLVRLVHYEGDFSGIARHLASQRHVHVIEDKIAPFLAGTRDTGTSDGFAAFFRNAGMRCLTQSSSEAQSTRL
ncbi:SchA/CurD-like domain-containing protein [Sphaerisporangium sp. TRM90804]|uniref:SchA/CurD-like domain-containing protein n=1 Tax=Sphaerisporangium sp. TRM90804 TaxID=3031113 RepID=UPI0024495CB4|nr:SchA/CurD-like domain-containing protein [Sphaerisporangium sp. TRM90804]MDH2426180.1 SchA/CurD-like domain-containing protein [Sphaerisporangium sp. TRM90804]